MAVECSAEKGMYDYWTAVVKDGGSVVARCLGFDTEEAALKYAKEVLLEGRDKTVREVP